MSKTVKIKSLSEFNDILKKSTIVVADFYADWCGPCKTIEPVYEQLSKALSRENRITFVKVNTDEQTEIAATYSISGLPTFLVFRNGKTEDKIQGADPAKLQAVIKKLQSEVESIEAGGEGSSSGGNDANWRGVALPRGYSDVSSQVELNRCELLNVDTEAAGGVRVLFDTSKPTALKQGKFPAKDWVESDTDEQLLLFVPFQSMLKLHTLQITSLPPKDDDEAPMRPRTIKIFTNKPHNLGFEEAEDLTATQVIELTESDWNTEGTANIGLRFVKFQNINSLVLFIVDGDGTNDSEKVRLDRIRLIGEAGEKREMGKLEKIGDEPGE